MGYCDKGCEYLTRRHNCNKYHKGLTYFSYDSKSLAYSSHERCSECDKDHIIADFEAQLNQSWIPVSERLPEAAELEAYGDEVTPVLITYLGYYDREPREGGLVIWCENNTWRWHDETLDVSMMDVVKVEITAWMPLPEPYRP